MNWQITKAKNYAKLSYVQRYYDSDFLKFFIMKDDQILYCTLGTYNKQNAYCKRNNQTQTYVIS